MVGVTTSRVRKRDLCRVSWQVCRVFARAAQSGLVALGARGALQRGPKSATGREVL